MAKKNFGEAVLSAKQTIEAKAQEINQTPKEEKLNQDNTVKKTFALRKDYNQAFNIAAAKRNVEKGMLLNQIIGEWLKTNGEL